MLSVLPTALISLLLFASGVFSQSTSLNDPFRAIIAHVPKPKQPENPICCLKPLTTSEPVDDGVLLSFEEWKSKQLGIQQASSTRAEMQDAIHRAAAAGGAEGNTPGADVHNTSDATVSPSEDNTGSTSSTEASTQERSSFSPSKAPLTDRFNYASLDCSARVHTAHRSAKSSSSILSSKRDRYMLSPCDTPKENQHVVVELCDDIRIDTIQLANFEFFSGVFKDFTVSVAKTYTNDPDAWTTVQTYRAKNTRGVQTFRPPDDLLDFYRFIRIDFHSHYGNEFYCPVSLLRVYGLTHLEEWKWDIWESESRAKHMELQKKRSLPASTVDAPTPIASSIADAPPSIPLPVESIPETAMSDSLHDTIDIPATPSSSSPSSPTSSSHSYPNTSIPEVPRNIIQEKETTIPLTAHDTHSSTIFATHSINDSNSQKQSTDNLVTSSISAPHMPTPSITQDTGSNIPTQGKTDTTTEITSHSSTASMSQSHSSSYSSHTSHSVYSPSASSETSSVVVSSNSPSVAVIPIIPSHPTAKGGESIYRTILNRLTEVEINQTLYMRYIEQQNLAIRDVMKRLGEDMGRLEGITRAQALNYQRNLDSWQRQRSQLEMEYVDLVLRVESLSEEIVLEKRLGVAQLCLLLAVLIFMGLTRGSRAEALIDHSSSGLNRSVREWGERHFKLSNSWAGRFKGKSLSIDVKRAGSGRSNPNTESRSRSRSNSRTRIPQVSRPKAVSSKTFPGQTTSRSQNYENGVNFPSSAKVPFDPISINTAPADTEYFPRVRTSSNPNSNSRSRVPSIRSTPINRRIHHQRPITPVTSAFRPQLLQRSSSHHGVAGGVDMLQTGSWGIGVPKSAKKWARTAHLHEVKAMGPVKRTRKRSGENVHPVVITEMNGKNVWHKKDAERTPREFDFDRDGEDLFTSSDAVVFPSSPGNYTSSPTLENSLLFKTAVESSPLDEGDAWVDTDSIDGSELDAEQTVTLNKVGVGSSPAASNHSRTIDSLS